LSKFVDIVTFFPKILKSGFDQNVGAGGLVAEIGEVPRTKGTQKTRWYFLVFTLGNKN